MHTVCLRNRVCEELKKERERESARDQQQQMMKEEINLRAQMWNQKS